MWLSTGFWIEYWIYWQLTSRNYKYLQHYRYFHTLQNHVKSFQPAVSSLIVAWWRLLTVVSPLLPGSSPPWMVAPRLAANSHKPPSLLFIARLSNAHPKSMSEIFSQLNSCGNYPFNILSDEKMGSSLISVLGFSWSVHFAHITCYWNFILLLYTQFLCQYWLYRADHAYVTYLMLQRQLSHLNGRKLDPFIGIATGYGLDDRRVGIRVPVGSRIFFSKSSRRSLGSTQPPIQWVLVALSPRVKLTTHLQPVPRWRKCGSIHYQTASYPVRLSLKAHWSTS
jgi:hypothetical protein